MKRKEQTHNKFEHHMHTKQQRLRLNTHKLYTEMYSIWVSADKWTKIIRHTFAIVILLPCAIRWSYKRAHIYHFVHPPGEYYPYDDDGGGAWLALVQCPSNARPISLCLCAFILFWCWKTLRKISQPTR